MKVHVSLAAVAIAAVFAVPAAAQTAPEFQACASCHSIDAAGSRIEGPNLKGVVGRKVASQPGFKYSEAMQKFAETHQVWTEALLDDFIKNAEEMVPGTSMNNAPTIRNAKTRNTIVEFLKAQK
jgi:cytochrome c2